MEAESKGKVYMNLGAHVRTNAQKMYSRTSKPPSLKKNNLLHVVKQNHKVL